MSSGVGSEHTSIFFSNSAGNLFLKATTAERFVGYDETKQNIDQFYQLKEFLNNSSQSIYEENDNSSLTYRAFKNQEPLITHNSFDLSLNTACKFCEVTARDGRASIVVPILHMNSSIGVIRCINKISKEDSLLHFFVDNDIELLKLATLILSIFHTKFESLQYQKKFLEHLGHENKTPVQVIWSAMDNIELKLKKANIKKDVYSTVANNFNNIRFYSSVIDNNYNNINTFVNHGTDKFSYLFEEVELKEKIQDITQVLRPLLIKEEGNPIAFSLHVHKLPKLYVDGTKMYQVIYNLLSNAVRYSNTSSVIEIFYKDIAKKIEIDGIIQDFFELKFCNHGIGINLDEKEKIFDQYFRSNEAMKVNPTGTGIGLYVTRKIIEGHGGIIKVTKLEKPTTFSIFLPNNLKI